MLRRGGNRLAMLLMTGVLLGDLWSWGARWFEMVLSPGEPTAQADCDHGLMIDPDGKCRSLLVEQQGSMIDPDGQPSPNGRLIIDPDGQSRTDDGLMIDPNG